jgi:hypothetical protein
MDHSSDDEIVPTTEISYCQKNKYENTKIQSKKEIDEAYEFLSPIKSLEKKHKTMSHLPEYGRSRTINRIC